MRVPSDAIIPSHEAINTFELAEGWSFRQADEKNEDDWLPVDKIPSNVHLDLRRHGKIPDPFSDLNELDVQWVGEKKWIYQCEFPACLPDGHRADLVFDGLDTFATVWLNGQRILESDNMFVQHRTDVTNLLKQNEKNRLSIDFDSALLKAREIKKSNPTHKWICWNGEEARLGVRKAQYHWGWDWGPKLVTCGISQPIRLEMYKARIAHLATDVKLASPYNTATVRINVELDGVVDGTVLVELRQGGNFIAGQAIFVSSAGNATTELTIDKPKLWWPNGHGEQPLYEVHATLGTGKQVVVKKIGIRQIELVQQPDKHGKSFFLRVNGKEIFGAGCNWIPADSFATDISEERYRKWLKLVAEGRQCVVRCWGGGLWEPDVFFDTCDELGILVWQDFLFACGNYPVNNGVIESIKAEAATQLRRLRDHACLALFAGNNEDYLIQESSKLTYDPKDKNPDSWLSSDFPARYLYEKLLPELVARHAPHVIYHPGSPFGDGFKSANDTSVGDLHQWNVWHGTQEKYQMYEKLGGRFVSEFGMEAMPVMQTVQAFTSRKSELYPQSRTLDFHNKATGHERRLATYVRENFRMRRDDLASWIYLTQLAQSEAVTFAYSSWRRQWGRGRKVGGALYWQLNDCWPTTSWALVDYYLRKKPAYYAAKRCMSPLAVHVRRDHHDWSNAHQPQPDRVSFDVWIASSHSVPKEVMVELRFISIRTGQDVQDRLTKSVTAVGNSTTEVISASVENDFHNDPFVISARLFAGSVVSRFVDWPQPLKYLHMGDSRGLNVKVEAGRAWITADKPVKGFVFEEIDGVKLSDNGFDVIPGDMRIIDVEGLKADAAPPSWTVYDHMTREEKRDELLGPILTGNGGTPGGSMKTVTPILIGSPTSPPRPRRRGMTVRFQDPPHTP